MNNNGSGILKAESIVGIHTPIHQFFPESSIKFRDIETISVGIYPVQFPEIF